MDPTLTQVLAQLDETLTQISQYLSWFFALNLGLTALTLLVLVLVWWRLARSLAHMHSETAKTLSDIAAQTREILRRTEP
jgi:hypothetical protein